MIIQKLMLPPSPSTYPQKMFYRGGAVCATSTACLYLAKGTAAWFDTFYNAVSVRTWRGDCELPDLSLRITGDGEVVVKFGLLRDGKSLAWLGDAPVRLGSVPVELSVPGWAELTEGLLFVTIAAISDACISDGAFVTEAPVVRPVKLGLVITHFNRQKQALAAANMLAEAVLDRADGEIELAIVDNSRNFPADALTHPEHVSVIGNINCGGSGGFTRGLLHFKDAAFTHCLFMDDDASCLPESIWRARTYFAYCKLREKIGVSGILLKDVAPNIVHEAGAFFRKGRCQAVCYGADVNAINRLLELDRSRSEGRYGAWCFFGFCIRDVTRYPFPFFVRGDDVLFGLSNHFKIKTLLGVATRIDDFANKDSPMTRYLSVRADLVISIFTQEAKPLRWWWNFRRLNRATVLCYVYGQADGVALAMEDILYREHLFDGDMTGSRFRAALAGLKQVDRPVADAPLITYQSNSAHEHRLRKIVRTLTLNGLLIPKCLYKKEIVLPKREGLNDKGCYRYKTVYYYNDEAGTVSEAVHNKFKITSRLWRSVPMLFKVLLNFGSARKKIESDIQRLTTEQFWRDFLLNK